MHRRVPPSGIDHDFLLCCDVFWVLFSTGRKKHQRVDFWIFWCGPEAQGGSLVDRLIPMDTSEDSSDSCPSSGLGVAVGEDLEQIEEDLQQLKTDIIEQAVDDTRKRSAQDESHNLSLEGSGWHWVVGIMVSVTVVKFILVLYCRSFTNEIVKAYAQDHLFDVVTNAIGLIAAILASKLYWWIDPAGAILLALYTMRTWSNTVLENVVSLVGKTAPPYYLQKLTYLCWNHDRAIRHIDTVKAYTFGSHYFVEVDIVLPSDMPLQQAHDVGEALQEKLESLPDIERAYVHLDHEYTHKPEHRKSHS